MKGTLASASNISPVGSPLASTETRPPFGSFRLSFEIPSAFSAAEFSTSACVPFQNQTGFSGAARSSSARVGSRFSRNLVWEAEAPTTATHSPFGVALARASRFSRADEAKNERGALIAQELASMADLSGVIGR